MAKKTEKPTGRVTASARGLSFIGHTKLAYDLWLEIGEATDAGRLLDGLYDSLRTELIREGVLDDKGKLIKEPSV